MPNLYKLQELIDGLDTHFRTIMKLPVCFEFVEGIDVYIKYIQETPVLVDLIRKEHEDLRDTRRKLPQAINEAEYERMKRIIRDKKYTNCSEDYMELTYIKEALHNRKNNTPADDMAPIDIKMEYDLWELEKNKAGRKNYYLEHEQSIRRSLNKVQTHLVIELRKLIQAEEANLGFTEKGLRFESIQGILYINGAGVKIKGQKRITWEYRILKYIFDSADISKEFFYTEINDDREFKKIKLSRYTTACEKIQSKILKQIGIGDFLIFNYSKTQGKVQINQKYLN